MKYSDETINAIEAATMDFGSRFLRLPAAFIADRAGQLKRGLTAPLKLYSEDLW